MMSMRGFSCVFDSAFASSDLSDLLFWGWICRGQDGPKIWHLLEIVRLGEIAFLGAITDLEEQSSTWRALPPIEGSLKLKSGAFLSPTTRALSIGRGCSEDLTGSS